MFFSVYELAVTTLALLTLVSADGTYRSRPDLAPPHLNITIPCDGRCEKGYLFIAPFTGYADPVDHGPLQGAPYILTETGDLVWSGFTYFSIWAGNFQAARWKGRDILFAFEGAHNSLHGHGHGHHTFLDQHYQNIRELHAGNHLLVDKHEFIVINEASALFQIYHPLQLDLEPYGGVGGQTWQVSSDFKVDIETGDVLFEWSSLEHITPDETALPLTLGQAGFAYNSSTAWDYFHINSIEKGSDGHYLLSARHASTIYKINGTDGSIIWRLGGKFTDFELGSPDFEVISLFENSVYGSESAGGGDKEVHLYPYSRGKYIRLDYNTMEATLQLAFLPPQQPILAKSQGSLQKLPCGNALINCGSEGQISEYGSDGEPVFHAFLDSGFLQDKLQNYRAFRYNWTGFSAESPAVFAKSVSGEGVDVHVSWNGDTRTKTWRYVWDEGTAEGTVHRSKDIERSGFETMLRIRADVDAFGKVSVEAIDASGHSLTVSESVRPVSAYWEKKGRLTKQRPSLFQQMLGEEL